ncbi:uncharacterized protein MONBRDRAFT_12160 [Monosiga brevicollis MX1]|uniref:Uncharacterized protein n=1 Tax=Monosiga brevicollis TaxID=81824 RepID=A9VBE3_MONBE|nr:uncharacterized protein MONBRDRAFT_12160 [Monosiga brevicollis MX1]EDQ85173.1 predicted protein [Monosiga brevicollis MX1]|eukprot:XP_001749998.1 hypothetical protein [Monosiga brevicollis MX1]
MAAHAASGDGSPPRSEGRERRIHNQRAATSRLRLLKSLADANAERCASALTLSSSHDWLVFMKCGLHLQLAPGSISPPARRASHMDPISDTPSEGRKRSTSAISSWSTSSRRGHGGADVETVVRQESQIQALRAETHALRMQLEAVQHDAMAARSAKDQLQAEHVATQAIVTKQLERINQLEQDSVAAQKELQHHRAARPGLFHRTKKGDDDLLAVLQERTHELQALRADNDRLVQNQHMYQEQLKAVEGIFIQAMAASGVKDLLRGDDGIECMQQLVNEFHLQKEENQSLQELLAESRSQILGSQAQCVKLQDMLNRDLQAELRTLRSELRDCHGQLEQLDSYAEEVNHLQSELKAARQEITAARTSRANRLYEQTSSGTVRISRRSSMLEGSALKSSRRDEIAELDDMIEAQNERIEEMTKELDQQADDFESERTFLLNEAQRHLNSSHALEAALTRTREQYAAETEMLRMQVEDLNTQLQERDSELESLRSASEQNMLELSTTITALQSVFDEDDEAARRVAKDNKAVAHVMESMDNWKAARNQQLRDARTELAEVNEQLNQTSDALAQAAPVLSLPMPPASGMGTSDKKDQMTASEQAPKQSLDKSESRRKGGKRNKNAHGRSNAPVEAKPTSTETSRPANGGASPRQASENLGWAGPHAPSVMLKLQEDQAECILEASRQLHRTRRELEQARRQLASVRAARNVELQRQGLKADDVVGANAATAASPAHRREAPQNDQADHAAAEELASSSPKSGSRASAASVARLERRVQALQLDVEHCEQENRELHDQVEVADRRRLELVRELARRQDRQLGDHVRGFVQHAEILGLPALPGAGDETQAIHTLAYMFGSLLGRPSMVTARSQLAAVSPYLGLAVIVAMVVGLHLLLWRWGGHAWAVAGCTLTAGIGALLHALLRVAPPTRTVIAGGYVDGVGTLRSASLPT